MERILDRLPERERQMMQVMSELAPEERRLTVIAHGMGFDSVTQAGPTARRLDTARGIIGRGSRHTFRHRAIEAYLTSSWPHSPA